MSSIFYIKLIKNQHFSHNLNSSYHKLLLHKNTNWLKCSQASFHPESKYYGFNPDLTTLKSNDYEIDCDVLKKRNENSNLFRYISAYREFGHLKGNINPIISNNRVVPELNPSLYGILLEDGRIQINGLLQGEDETLSGRELQERLDKIYCGELTAEFMHLPTLEEREWFGDAFEKISTETLSDEEKKVIAKDLVKSQVWDRFLTVKFPSVKRYGNEGAESTMAFYRKVFESLSKEGVEELIFGMCHRGRLNLLTGLLEVKPEKMFHKLKGKSEYPSDSLGYGDVLSHFVSSVDLNLGGTKPLHVTMLPNPSHLEAQDSVVCGKARGRQRRLKEGHYSLVTGSRPGDKVACLQVHGDGALSGQGIVQETLELADVPNFSIGGTIHMCINNQLGFTTPADQGRSSLYCTDVAKLCSFPAIHVNGDCPEAVVKAASLAVAYNRKFRRDIFVDICCWRRWGHNELDDPRFTNPGMYKIIDNKTSVPDSYSASLIEQNILSEEEKNEIVSSHNEYLGEKLSRSDSYNPTHTHLLKHWSTLRDPPNEMEVWDTGVDISLLKFLGAKSVKVPHNFNVHPHIQKTHIASRLQRLSSGENIDWATAESLAFASLLHQGYDIRLSGEDVGRGTFSQRHCALVDQETDDIYIPLNQMGTDQTHFLEVANSILSEEAVLGFEYGVSIESPRILCVWEAQFGDFFNGAQVILDTYVSSGEEKWLMQSGLVILLPHGYDGAGPEHSSCRMERFLQMSTSSEDHPDSERVNWNIIFPTTSAQIFHALRRQMIRNYRKPLIVIGPKAILRLPAAFSSLDDMAIGTHFLSVIGDSEVKTEEVKKVVFVTGKHYYLLKSEREKLGIKDTAIIRIESLCPFPTKEIREQLNKYNKAKTFIWSQEEHRNMGGWSFVSSRFRNLCGRELKYAGRKELGAVAVGIGTLHQEEVQSIIKQTFQ